MDWTTFYDLPALSGDEFDLHQALSQALTDQGLSLYRDQLGSVLGLKPREGAPFRVMMTTNLDENGGLIQAIRPDGLLDFVALGRYQKTDYVNQVVRLLTRDHAPHVGYGVLVEGQPYLALGAASAQQVADLGIQVGDSFVLDFSRRQIGGGAWLGRNLANRASLQLILDISRQVQDKLTYELAVGGISQSLVGTRGAITATNVIQPDLALVLDASPVPASDYDPKCLYLRYFDKTLLPNTALLEAIRQVAQGLGYQVKGQVQEAGTDGAFIHKTGVGAPTLVIALPLLQSSGLYQCLDPASFEPVRDTLVAFLSQLTPAQVRDFGFGSRGGGPYDH